MRSSSRLRRSVWASCVPIGLFGGCFGEDGAVYQGTVVEAEPGERTSFSFDDAPNPDARPALSGLRVQLCRELCRSRNFDVTDDDGAWGPLSMVFGLPPGSDGPRIHVRVFDEDVRVFEYDAPYGRIPSEERNGSLYMNIALGQADAPTVGQPDGGVPDAGATAR